MCSMHIRKRSYRVDCRFEEMKKWIVWSRHMSMQMLLKVIATPRQRQDGFLVLQGNLSDANKSQAAASSAIYAAALFSP